MNPTPLPSVHPLPPSTAGKLKGFVIRHEKTVWVLFLIFGMFTFYLVINAASIRRHAWTLVTPVDRAVPFEAGWEYVYVFVFLFILLPLFVVRDIQYFRRIGVAYVLLLSASYVVYLAFPVRMVRPKILPDSFADWGVRINYLLDKPQNCFPSLHLGSAFLTSFALLKANPLVGIAATVLASLIGLSTLYVKQHYLLDVVGGCALAGLIYYAVVHRYRLSPEHREWTLRPLFQVATLYGALLSWAYAAYRTHLF